MNGEGWTWLSNSRRWHYFVGGRSLCGRWFTFATNFELGDDDAKHNCRGCRTKLKARKKKEAEKLEQENNHLHKSPGDGGL